VVPERAEDGWGCTDQPMTSQPTAVVRTPPLLRRFVRFSLVGFIGFVVDTSTLSRCLWALQLGHYEGRLVSYLAAATSTWLLNRRFTFADAVPDRASVQWSRFLAVNAIGGAANYGTYAGLIATSDLVVAQAVLGVAAGSFAGLIFNFTGSRLLVFRALRPQGACRA
jgi:putative flippase GtrA